jgi:hypothetical protein
MAGCGNGDPANLVRVPIGPNGGLITSHDGVLTIVLQPGALDDLYDIEIFPSDEPPVIFGPAYRVRPDFALAVPAEVTYRRALPADPEGVAVAAIRRQDYEAEMGHWSPLPTLDVNLAADEVLATDDELSLYYGLLSGDDAAATTGADGGPGGGPGGGPDTAATSGSGDTAGGGTTSEGDTTDTGPRTCGDGNAMAGEVCFAAMDFTMGAAPSGVTIGDFDGDGDLDVATSNAGASTISLRYGDGTGALGGQNTETVGGGPAAIVSGDLDNDGDDDLVVALGGDGGAVLVVAQGGGAFAVQAPSNAGSTTVDLALAFLDPDGRLDVVAIDAAMPAVYPFLTTDMGLQGVGFVALDQLAGAPVGVAAGSFNDASGDLDGDAFAFGGGGLQGFDGTGAGGFTPGGIAAALGVDLGRAYAVDFTGDAFSDIAVVDRSGGVYVLTGDGTATFAASSLIATGSAPSDVVVADVTGDGRLDLIVVDALDDTVTIAAQDAAGGFSVVATFDVAGAPSGVAVGDLNGDGIVDIAVSASSADAVTVLLSEP